MGETQEEPTVGRAPRQCSSLIPTGGDQQGNVAKHHFPEPGQACEIPWRNFVGWRSPLCCQRGEELLPGPLIGARPGEFQRKFRWVLKDDNHPVHSFLSCR